MVLAVGVSGVECAAGVGRMCTGLGEGVVGSGLLVAWAVALGSNFVGSGLRLSFWGSSTVSFPLPSPVNKGRISYFILHGPYIAHNSRASYSSSEASTGSSINSS